MSCCSCCCRSGKGGDDEEEEEEEEHDDRPVVERVRIGLRYWYFKKGRPPLGSRRTNTRGDEKIVGGGDEESAVVDVVDGGTAVASSGVGGGGGGGSGFGQGYQPIVMNEWQATRNESIKQDHQLAATAGGGYGYGRRVDTAYHHHPPRYDDALKS